MDSAFNYSSGGKIESTMVPDDVIKIVLIGDEGCGKSTLVQAFMDCRPCVPIPLPPPPPGYDGSSLSVSLHESHQSSSPEEQMPYDQHTESSPENVPHPLHYHPDYYTYFPPPRLQPLYRPPSPNANFAPQEHGARFKVKVGTVEGNILDKDLILMLTDVPGGDKKADKRTPVYTDAKVILVCFSIDDPVSLVKADLKWLVEAQRLEPKVPKILVGLKQDLRTNVETLNRLREKGWKPISSEHGLALKERCSFINYIECSAVLPYHNVVEVFEMACLESNDNWISVTIEDDAEAHSRT